MSKFPTHRPDVDDASTTSTRKIDQMPDDVRAPPSSSSPCAARRRQECHKLLMSALGIVIFLQASLRSEGITGLKKKILKSYDDFSVLMCIIGLELLQLYYGTRSSYDLLKTCYRTAAEVLQHYALLLLINRSYIRIAIFPVIILVFIGGLAKKFKDSACFGYNSNKDGFKSARELRKMAWISWFLQFSFVIWTLYNGEQGGTFVHCHFLLFINSSLAALAGMIAEPPIRESPGAEQVLAALHKSCLIMLMIATWTMTAEWLGEGIILVCMPEFIAVVVWFTNRFDNAGRVVMSFNAGTWARLSTTGLTILLVLRTDLLFTYVKKILVRSTFYIAISSSALSYLHVWMLHQWPERISNSNGPIKQIKFSMEYSMHTTALLAVWSVGLWILELMYGDQVPNQATHSLLLTGLIVYLTIAEVNGQDDFLSSTGAGDPTPTRPVDYGPGLQYLGCVGVLVYCVMVSMILLCSTV